MHDSRRRLKLAASVLLPFLALGLQIRFWDELKPLVWILFYPTVFCSGWLGGLVGGSLSTLISILLVDWFFIEPQYSLVWDTNSHGWSILVFAVTGMMASLVHHRLRLKTADLESALENTQRILAQKNQSESRFRALFEQSPLGIALIDSLTGQIYEVNQRYADIVGRPREQMADIDWMSITHPDDVQEDLDNMTRVNAGEMSSFHMDKRYLKPGGEVVCISMTIAPVAVEAGQAPRHICMVEDVTERLAKEKALSEAREQLARADSEQHLALLIQQSLVGVGESDDQFRITQVNERFCEMLGYAREELLGKTIQDITHPDDWPANKAFIADLDNQDHAMVMQKRYVRKDGTPLWASIATGQIKDEAGLTSKRVVMMVDIHEHKQAEQSLRLAIEAARLGVWHWNLRTNQIEGSCYLFELLGLHPDTSPSYEVFLSALHPDDREATEAAICRSLAELIDYQQEYRVVWPDGSEHWIMSMGRAYAGADNQVDHMEGVVYDITPRKLVELELAEQRRCLAEAQSIAKIGSWSHEQDGHVIWSDETYRLLGVERGVFSPNQDSLLDLAHPEDRALMEHWFRPYFAAIRPRSQNFRRCQPDGSLRYLSVEGELQYDDKGEPLRMMGTVQDITEQYLADQTIREGEQRRRLALEALQIGEWELRLGDYTGIRSEIHGRIFGYAPPLPDWNYRLFMEHVVPEDLSLVAQDLRKVIAGHGPWDREFRIRRADGAIRWVHARAILRGLKRLTGIIVDITERKENELRLLESERRFRELFEHLPIAYQSLDIQGHWLDGNQHLADLLGFECPEAMIGKNFVDYWDDSIRDQFDSNYEEFKRRYSIEGELLLHRTDGRPVNVQVSGRIQRDQEGMFLRTHCILLNVTERRALERQTLAMNAELERKVEERTAQLVAANAAKNEFLAHMSHEIRTPLNTVLGLSQLLVREPLTLDQQDMVGNIRMMGQSLLAIINDILDFSKIEAGQLRLDAHNFDPKRLVASIDSLLGQQARSKGLRWQVYAESISGLKLRGDEMRMEQVLLNLASNAIKFTHQGSISLKAVPLELTDTSVRLRFEVADTGIGIAPELRSGLFQPFVQADGSITRRFGGTGLGLAICKRLVELMGGRIDVDSVEGEGSTFWFELPFSVATNDEPLPSSAECLAPAGPRLGGLRILAVDDNLMNLKVIGRMLKLEGASVELATDGLQALQILRAGPKNFDAVLMDVQMPVMDGLSATRAIRADPLLAKLPVIAFTAGVIERQREDVVSAGMNDLLPKPVDLQQLVEVLSRWTSPQTMASGWQAPVESLPQERAWPQIPGIDSHRVQQTLGRDWPLYLGLMEAFHVANHDEARLLRDHLSRSDWLELARHLHKLQGMCGNIGALDLMRSARDLEQAMLGGGNDIAPGLEAFADQLDELLAAFKPWLEAATAQPTGSPEQSFEALEILRDLLLKRNLASLRQFSEVESTLASNYGLEATRSIGEAIKMLRFDEALALLDRSPVEA